MKTDFLVIGSGIAGLNFALKVSKYGKVTVITKKEIIESNTNYAQGGIAAVMEKYDSFTKHINDTLKVGCRLGNKKNIEIMVKNAPKEVKTLTELGIGFDRTHGKLDLTKEGGHSKRRIVHIRDVTGREIEETLVSHVRNNENIEVYEKHIAIDLIKNNDKCIGAQVLDVKNNKIINIFSKVTVLATGGLGEIYLHSSNPKIATGDGVAIAHRTGAKIEDIEFVQFHPTALDKKNCRRFLISETIRGEGAVLLNSNKERFMKKYHKLKELAPRDIMTRAILKELKKGKVYIDVRNHGDDFLKKRFPTIYRTCYECNLNITKQLIPISPVAHYSCGGIKTNSYGETNVKCLFAFGEVACTGVHGANRLPSNSLLESVVFSSRGIKKAKQYLKKKVKTKVVKSPKIIKNMKQTNILRNKLRKIMWNNVGIIKSVKDCNIALKKINEIELIVNKIKGINYQLIELRNMVLVAKLITTASLKRKNSIGVFYNKDFPKSNSKKHIMLVK